MNLIETPTAPTRIAVDHATEQTDTTMGDVLPGDFVILVHQTTRIRGLRVNSQLRTINRVEGSPMLAVEFTAARGSAYRIHPDHPVTVRRATRFEKI